jgi:hypothetical protein
MAATRKGTTTRRVADYDAAGCGRYLGYAAAGAGFATPWVVGSAVICPPLIPIVTGTAALTAGAVATANAVVNIRNKIIEGNTIRRGEARIVPEKKSVKLVQPVDKPEFSNVTHFSDQRKIEALTPRPAITEQQLLPAASTQSLTAREAANLIPRDKMTWCPGVDDATGQPMLLPIREALHTLVVASTGQGKTTLNANLLYQLVALNNPSLYKLIIMDVKGTLAGPFAPYGLTTTRPDGYVKFLEIAAAKLKARMEAHAFDAPLMLIVVEEALYMKRYLDPVSLERYARAFDLLTSMGREYGVYVVAASQVDYADDKFRASRGQFMTRFGGAVMPKAAESMGFMNTELVKRLWKEKRPGNFLLEGPDGDRVIRAPTMNLKGGELSTLLAELPAIAITRTKGTSRPGDIEEQVLIINGQPYSRSAKEIAPDDWEGKAKLVLQANPEASVREVAALVGCSIGKAHELKLKLVA